MTPDSPPFVPRWSNRITLLAWLAWLIVAAWLCVPPLLWHFDYARNSHPQLYLPLIAGLVACSFVIPAAYQFIRRKRIWRCELLLLSGFCAAGLLFYQPLATLVIIWIVVAAYALGRFCRERLALEVSSPAADIALSVGIGLGALTCALFVIGLLGGYRGWVFIVLLGGPSILFRRQAGKLWVALRQAQATWSGADELRSPLISIVVVVTAIILACAMMVVLAPNITFDPLRFHLPLAQHYVTAGALTPISVEPYSYYPQGVEVLIALAFALGGQPAAQMLPPVFFVLALLVVIAIARECGIGRIGTVTGAALIATVPFIHWTGSGMKNDMAVAFYQLAGLLVYFRWRSSGNFNWIRVGVFFAAMSAGVKHPAVFGVIPLAMLYAHAAWRQPRRVRAAASLGAVFALFGLMWFARTWVLTGNPVYPANADQMVTVRAVRPDRSTEDKFRLYAAWPWYVHFQGERLFHSVTPNPMGMFLVVSLPLWLILRRRRRSRAERVCYFFVAVFLLYWCNFYLTPRYAIAALALLLLFGGARLAALEGASGKWMRASARLAVSFCFLFSLTVMFILEVNAPQFRLFAKKLDGEGYLSEALLTYPSLEYLKGRAGPNDLVYSLRNCSRAYAPYPDRFVCAYHRSSSEGFERAEQNLAARDYRYMILPEGPDYQPVLETQLQKRRVEHLFSDENFAVYELMQPKQKAGE